MVGDDDVKNKYYGTLKVSPYLLLADYLLLVAMLSNYFEPVTIWYGLLFGLILIVLFIYKNYAKLFFSHSILLFGGAALLFISMLISDSYKFLSTNLLNILTPTVACISMSTLMIWKKDDFKRFLFSRGKLLNIWWLLNLIILMVQESGMPLFIKSQWLANNKFYPDLCCGFFGYNRTHELAFFSCMILVCNLRMYTQSKRKSLLVYTVITETAMLIMSYFNDNTAFFILLPVVLILYLVLSDAKHNNGIVKKALRIFMYIILVIGVIVLLIQIPLINKIFNEYIMERINAFLLYKQHGFSGSNERLAIIGYAFRQPRVWRFGLGIGSDLLSEHVAYGFRHFGISSMGTILFLVGIWYFLVHSILLSVCSVDLVLIEERKTYYHVFPVVFLFIIGASFYSPIMTSAASMIWISIMFAYM